MVGRAGLYTFTLALACTANPPPRDAPASEPVAVAPAERSAEQELRERTGFPHPPRGTAPNCGPEHRFAAPPIDSRATFLALLREHIATDDRGDRERRTAWGELPDRRTDRMPRLRLDSFRAGGPDGKLDWSMIGAAVTTEEEGGVTYYRLEFRPRSCSGYTLTLTSVGAGSVYGCCGK